MWLGRYTTCYQDGRAKFRLANLCFLIFLNNIYFNWSDLELYFNQVQLNPFKTVEIYNIIASKWFRVGYNWLQKEKRYYLQRPSLAQMPPHTNNGQQSDKLPEK